MGHIINPTLYRIGRTLPWISAGYKRRQNDRTNRANEDFLIYNFTRNFFLNKVYKKVIGKIKKQKLNVRRKGKKVRKNKRKRKYGKKALLNNWIIRYSHLTISRFNKTFQLNLFFFDRELQKKYRIRLQRTKRQIRALEKKVKLIKIKNLKKKIKYLNKKLKRVKYKTKITTKITFDKALHPNEFGLKFPTQGVVSSNLAEDLSKVIITDYNSKINLTLGHKLKKNKDALEKLVIFKDNTYADNKVASGRLNINNDIDTDLYRQMFISRLKPKLYYIQYQTKYAPNRFGKPWILSPDRFYFSNLMKKLNLYYFVKYSKDIDKNIFRSGFREKNKYLEEIKKNGTAYVNNYKIGIAKQLCNNMPQIVNSIKHFKLNNKISNKTIIKSLKNKDIWNKHQMRIKGYLKRINRKVIEQNQKYGYNRQKRKKYKNKNKNLMKKRILNGKI